MSENNAYVYGHYKADTGELNCKFIILTEETILNWKELL